MSNIVCTWENEVNAAGEIELTDAQLAAVFGAWGEQGECFRSQCKEEESCFQQCPEEVQKFEIEIIIKPIHKHHRCEEERQRDFNNQW